MPFIGPEPGNPSRWRRITTVDLRQVGEDERGRTRFQVLTEFGYTDAEPAGTDEAGEHWPASCVGYLVPREMLTDLATVPRFLWGVVASYGRQTLPAIVHDQLCDVSRLGDPPSSFRHGARREADAVFLQTLAGAGTGPVRRWLMWTGVRFGGHRGVSVAYGALLASIPAVALLPWRAAAAVAAGASAVAYAGAVAAASVECRRAPSPTGGRRRAAPPEYTSARFDPRAAGSLLGAAVLGAVAAPLLLPVAVLTVATRALVGIGERPVRTTAPAGTGARPAEKPTARITWAPVGPGDSTVNGNPGIEDVAGLPDAEDPAAGEG